MIPLGLLLSFLLFPFLLFLRFQPVGFGNVLGCLLHSRVAPVGLTHHLGRSGVSRQFTQQVGDCLFTLLRRAGEIYLGPASHVRCQQRIEDGIQLWIEQSLRF